MNKLALIACAAAIAACTEPRADGPSPRPAVTLEPHVEVSNTAPVAGSSVVVTVRFSGLAIASTTARLSYDSSAFAFSGEEKLDDAAQRVINPGSGSVRFAAVSAGGFIGGKVYAMRFTALRSAPADFHLTVDEAHTVSGADARASLARTAP